MEHFQEFGGLGNTGARRRRRTQAGVVRGEMPAGRAAQRKAADDQTVLVDGIIFADLCECFEQVGLAGEAVAVAVAAVKVKDESVRRNKFARGFLAAIDETEFAQRLAAAMKPKIQ